MASPTQVRALYEDGVFKPLAAVDLPNRAEVGITVVDRRAFDAWRLAHTERMARAGTTDHLATRDDDLKRDPAFISALARHGVGIMTRPKKMPLDDRYQALLERRIPVEDVAVGRAYVVHARNGGVGIAVIEAGHIGYRIHREKFGNHFLFVEWDWEEGPPRGTAIPLSLVDAQPPRGDDEVTLAWLVDQENEHRAQIQAAWEAILGGPLPR
jgi:predicted DNA-binding antitoxin AbrB/MazE fold protein